MKDLSDIEKMKRETLGEIFIHDNCYPMVYNNEVIQIAYRLGKILEQAEKVKFFTEDGLKLLSEACEKRNFVIHHLFREDLFKGYVDTQPEYYYETVEETIGMLHEINEQLVEIFKQQKKQRQYIVKKKYGNWKVLKI